MAERKFLYRDDTHGYMVGAPTTDSITLGGLTMNGGGITMASQKVTGLADATTNGDALAYGQASWSLAAGTITGDLAMSSQKITGLADPTTDQEAATKAYVDSVAAGLDPKDSVVVRAQGNITLSGPGATIDGVTMSTGDRFLADQQSTTTEDGIYEWNGAAAAATRSSDAQTGDAFAGVFVFIEEGTDADRGYVCTNNGGADVVGTDDLAFTQFTGLGQVTAGDGLTKTGDTIDVVGGDGITANANDIALDLKTSGGLKIDTAQLAVEPADFAGTGLEDDGSDNLRIATAAAGDGLTGGGGSALAVNLEASNPSLQIVTDELGIKFDGTTLQKGSGGTSVKGLPSLFEINAVAVGATVTAANLDELTDGSETTLHTHAAQAATEVPKVEDTLTTATDATSDGDPVYINGNDTIGKATASSADVTKAQIIGVIRTGSGAAGATPEVVNYGPCPGVLTGATANTGYYVGDSGGLVTYATVSDGNRAVRCGYAINATDLFVIISDFGLKAA